MQNKTSSMGGVRLYHSSDQVGFGESCIFETERSCMCPSWSAFIYETLFCVDKIIIYQNSPQAEKGFSSLESSVKTKAIHF